LDPFFLYQLSITADDFHSLRTEQHLLVDFVQFPIKFIELLEECIKNKGEEHPKQVSFFLVKQCSYLRKNENRFLARLGSDNKATALFSVIETNSFRNIVHIALSFIPGNDLAVKVYLAGLVKELKSQKSDLMFRLDNTGHSLVNKTKETDNTIKQLTQELEDMKVAHSQQKTLFELDFTKQFSEEKEKFSNEREMYRMEYERKLRELEMKYQEQVSSNYCR
jgi:spindle assembly abnormal protein 6